MPVAGKALRTTIKSRGNSARFICAHHGRGRKMQIFGYVTPRVLKAIQEDYAIDSSDDSFVDVTDSDWYKESEDRLHNGGLIGILRGHRNMSQADLGKVLKVTGKYVSDMEHGRRAVSVKMAKKLSEIFGRRPERFLPLNG